MFKIEMIEWTSNNCQACKAMRPAIEAVNKRLKDLMGYEPIREVNANEETEEANKARVTSFPTFDMMVNGMRVERSVGTKSIRDLEAMVKQWWNSKKDEGEGNH
jgi:thiol-disulfide isomerase/thioredoxin